MPKKNEGLSKKQNQIETDPPVSDEIIISQENVASLKDWKAQ
jgi:hypothetical protein